MDARIRHRRRIAALLLATFLLAPGDRQAASQEKREVELTAQEIVARVDRIMNYPVGLIKGRMLHVSPDGKSSAIDFVANTTDTDFLFTFSTRDRGDSIRVLYNFSGEDIWVYSIHAMRLFHKVGVDKYDPIYGTNFTFVDFSNADLQSNFTAQITGDAIVKNMESYRLRLTPIYKGGQYGQLNLYVSKSDFVPLRIDYHDNDKVIFKTLSVVQTISKGNRILPTRYDMLDIKKGTVTIVTFFGFDEKASYDKSIFRHQTLGDRR